jgi:glycine betaine/proline transport system permease protein
VTTTLKAPERQPELPPERKRAPSIFEGRRFARWQLLVGVLVVWILLYLLLKGEDTLAIGGQATTEVHDWFKEQADAIQTSDSWLISLTNQISDILNWIIEQCQALISAPEFPRVTPEIGWFGVVAIAGWIALALAGWRSAILVIASFVSFGLLGYWEDSMDTLIVTLVSVAIAVAIGMPLAVWMGNSKRATTFVTPILDVFQTFPGFTYLPIVFIFFGLGAAAATVATLIYALPPVIRIAAHGIRSVSPTTLEATTSLGQSKFQQIRKVQVPMAKSTIIVGINQTTMAALSMATIAAFIDGPGLGQPVINGLQLVQVGAAFVPGLAIVIMAIMLDRTTTAISLRSERLQRAGGGNPKLRYGVLAGTGALTLVAVYYSRLYIDLANFPETDIGPKIADWTQSASDWVEDNLDGVTKWFTQNFTEWFLNPLQDLLAESPWYISGLAIVAIAGIVGGRWAAVTSASCLAGIYVMDLWHNSMIMIAITLFATVFVMILALTFGVWMGRSVAADRALRPVLDAGQTLPPFVYLIPAFALFGPTRFMAIVAAVAYAAPAAIKIVADGIRGVSATTVEAATAAGSSRWQIIGKVQLPMARGGVMLAANQGLLYVLAMAVIGGMVGAGALGYDIVAGFRQGELVGRGIAAAISVVLIGIMLDRITRRAAMRSEQYATSRKPGAGPTLGG